MSNLIVTDPDGADWSLALLSSFRDKASRVRAHQIYENVSVLHTLENRTGEFATASDAKLHFIRSRIYLDLFERLCQMAEDFVAVALALQHPVLEFANRIGKCNPGDQLKKLTSEHWRKALSYRDLSGLWPEALEVIEKVRIRNIEYVEHVAGELRRWLKVSDHWLIFCALKHGNTVFHNAQPIEMWNEPTYAYMTRTRAGQHGALRVMYMNRTIFDSMLKLVEALGLLTWDFAERALWTVSAGTKVIEHSFLTVIPEDDVEALKAVMSQIVFQGDRTPLDHVTFDLNVIPPEQSQTWLRTYYGDLLKDISPFRKVLGGQLRRVESDVEDDADNVTQNSKIES